MNEATIELIESTANMLRGMCMDPAIPKHAKEAMRLRVAEMDKAAEDALESEDAAPAVPAGFALIPNEPTTAMLTAAADAAHPTAFSPVGIWAAMLAAAPKPA
jgi:hypothetical protein